MKLSLRQRLLLPTLAVITLSLAVLGGIAYLNSRSTVTRLLSGQTDEICRSLALSLDDWIQVQINDVETWTRQKVCQTATQDSFVGKAARKAAGAEFGQLVQSRDYCEAIHLADTNGLVVASSLADQVDHLNVSDRSYFGAALQGRLVISEVLVSKASGKPVVVIAAPVRVDDATAGVLLNVVKLEAFTAKFVNPVKLMDTGYAFVYARTGRLLAHPDPEQVLKFDLAQQPWGAALLGQESGRVNANFNGIAATITCRACAKLPWGVAVAVPEKELGAPARRLGWVNLGFGALFLTLSVVVLLLVLRSITRPLVRITEGVSDSSGLVASSASHISAASQSLAEGASEQAASLEESSASLEEMSTMTRRNAENAQKANALAREARTAADKGAADMQHMSVSMAAIKASSDDVAKIIKTIDEIAFQTNILALNAAVEAARAGAAGMGFAVVADEVRSLAQRSAHAAKETAAKIETAIVKTAQGVELTEKVAQALQAIVAKTRQVDELAAEVAGASREQTQGISQINAAVSQMDQVTQSNAANAEESAAAATELNNQADTLKVLVADLLQLVEGSAMAHPGAGLSPARTAGPAAPVEFHGLPPQTARPGRRRQSEVISLEG